MGAPKRSLHRPCSAGVITVSAKNPKTTVGTPASSSSTGFSVARTPGRAYSLRYTALIRPTGSAKAAPTLATRKVPHTSGQMPKCFSAPSSGLQVVPSRKSERVTSGSWMKWKVSHASVRMIAKVMPTLNTDVSTSAPRTSRSRLSRSAVERSVPR